MTAGKRALLEETIRKYCNSPYRREREYGLYLDRFLNGEDRVVDGMDFDTRQNKEPMPFNIFIWG